MKSRIICALTLIFITTLTFSQIKVIISGNAGIGSGASAPLFPLAVGGDNGSTLSTLSAYGSEGNAQRALRVYQPISSTSSHTSYGIVSSFDYGAGGHKLFAVYANAYRGSTANDDARTYGVLYCQIWIAL